MGAVVTLDGTRIVCRAVVKAVNDAIADGRITPLCPSPAAARLLHAADLARAILAGPKRPKRRNPMQTKTDRPVRPRPRPRPRPRMNVRPGTCPACGTALVRYRGLCLCPTCPLPYRPA